MEEEKKRNVEKSNEDSLDVTESNSRDTAVQQSNPLPQCD
jgi:hypothetical protein